jgi:hypothetical protein
MLVGTARRDSASIDIHIEYSREDKINGVVATSLSDQSFASRHRENLYTIRQLFREFAIASDDFLGRECFDAETSAPFPEEAAQHFLVFPFRLSV